MQLIYFDTYERREGRWYFVKRSERAWYAAYQAGFADTDTDTDDDAGPGPAGPDRGTQAAGLTAPTAVSTPVTATITHGIITTRPPTPRTADLTMTSTVPFFRAIAKR